MSELLIPFAVDEKEQLCSPKTAERGKNYFCPACKEPVIFRHGDIKIPHFAHKVSLTCNQETVTHKTAKLLILNVIEDWKSGKSGSPKLYRKCQICGKIINQPLPEKVDSALLEYKLSDGSIADVGLMVEGKVQAAVEIKVTHAVDKIKANRLPIPFIELDGYEVINNPVVWKPITDNFNPLTCDQCKTIYTRFNKKILQIAKASNLELPKVYYRYSFCKCWKCKREIIVFTWPSDNSDNTYLPKIMPPPKTVQFRYSKTVGRKYWANTCPVCHSLQGDYFLYSEPGGPFFGLNCEEDSSTAFERDMLRISTYAAKIGLL
jgi:ribosomal protein S27E